MERRVPSRRPWRHAPTLRHRLWQIKRWARRFATAPRVALIAVFGAAIAGWFLPDLRAESALAWLRDPSRIVGLAQDVVVPRPGGPGDGPLVLRPQGTDGRGAFRLCAERRQPNCVVDGDTIRYGGIKIRLADIDTPEIYSPKCASEADLGQRATERLLELLNSGRFEVVASGGRDADRYGRKLRVVTRHGHSLGDVLVAEGLARPWDGARRSWCG